jgi:flagellar biosynthesis/type III secretory pathway protein FliH
MLSMKFLDETEYETALQEQLWEVRDLAPAPATTPVPSAPEPEILEESEEEISGND